MQNSDPLVTVICSCYNHSDYIEIALDSVLNQTYKNIQLIIIDDYSTDNSVEVIENWISKNNKCLFIKNKNNLGLTKSFNKAFANVKGDYFIDLAGDDSLMPECVSTQVSVYKKFNSESIGIVYGNAQVENRINKSSYVFFDKFSQNLKTFNPKDGKIYKELINHKNTICSVSALINRRIFGELGGYDDTLIYEDYDYWLRVARKYPILYIDKILVKRIKTKSSLGNTNYLRFNKKTIKFKKSTYCVVKKLLKLNKNKEEDYEAIGKIKHEIKENVRILNLILVIKYIILWFHFKKNKHVLLSLYVIALMFAIL